MVCIANPQNDPRSSGDDEFLKVMQVVERHAQVVFRSLPSVDREEAVAEAVAAAFVAYRRLRERGVDGARQFPSMLATYAALHVKDGRHVGTRRNSKDVLAAQAWFHGRITADVNAASAR